MQRLTPSAYRRVTFAALALLCLIVVTGGAVRLTGSGLGCTDWPNCEEGRLTPSEITDAPAMVEFVNRTITGAVSVAVILAVLGSLVRTPRRADLTRLSIGLVLGVLAQIVLGGLVVLFDLSPRLVMGHFLLSMVIVWNAVLLHHRAGRPDGAPLPGLGAPAPDDDGGRLLSRLVVVVASVVVFTGTVVTAAGPHAGDSQAARLDLAVAEAARVHGAAVLVLIGLSVLARRAVRGSTPEPRRAADVLLVVLLAQAGVGYLQYFTGVPVLLVGIHLCGALAVWIAALRLSLATGEAVAPAAPRPVLVAP